MNFFILIVAGIFLVLFGFVMLVISLRLVGRDNVTGRLQNFVTETDDINRMMPARIIVRTRDFSGSLISRTFLPALRGATNFLGRLTPMGLLHSFEHQLMVAGHPMNLGARQFFGICVLFGVLGLGLGIVILQRGSSILYNLAGFLSIFAFFLMPMLWLRMRMRGRQKIMRRGMPDALDMLSVCASAGLGFDQSLQRVSDYWKTPIGGEFGRVIAEMEMGVSRAEALRAMAYRLDITELSSFVSLIIQSDQLGMSISDTLHAQAEQMRTERHFRAQEEARKIPIKMLIPMGLLIFPAIMAFVLGPAIPQLVEFFQNFG